MQFSDLRSRCDQHVIAQAQAAGSDARYKAGEFGAMEIGLAVRESKYSVQKVLGMVRRLCAEAPNSWDAWVAGDINQDKAIRINRALRLLVRDESKQLLNHVVVDVAVCKTPELLGRWLNQFIARVEPDQADERIRRSLLDRYVSVRPDVDGVSSLNAMVSAVDAVAIDQVLTAVAALAEPGDSRNLQQRRADALVDMLLGRISNGCTTRWDTNSDEADDEESGDDESGDDESGEDESGDDESGDEGRFGAINHHDPEDVVAEGSADVAGDHSDDVRPGGVLERAVGSEADQNPGLEGTVGDGSDSDTGAAGAGGVDCGTADLVDSDLVDSDLVDSCGADDQEMDDWDLPASAFRPDPPRAATAAEDAGASRLTESTPPSPNSVPAPWRATPGGGTPHGITIRPVQVNIGIVVSAASLFGFTNTPGDLVDRSASVDADTIRDLAAQPGTLFHRLITDERGNLLDVTELGRFPSRKLGLAITYRDGVCTNPICSVPAARCDHDHVVPVPDGPTTAGNLDEKCRSDHRAKTHAGHRTRRTGPHAGEWITPTGHAYETRDDPLPVEGFPDIS